MTISLNQRMKNWGSAALLYGPLTFVAIFMMLPFVWMLSTSLKPPEEIFTRPPILVSPNMSLDGYRYISENTSPGVWQALRNTFLVAGSFTTVSLFFCSLGGFGFAKYRFPGRNLLFTILLATLVIPGAVTLVPTYVIMTQLGWIDKFWPLVIPGAANAFGIFFMRQYISTISDELLDSARIDGASEFGIFWHVVFPMVRPGLVSLGLIFFMASWNNYLGPLIYLHKPDLFTLPLLQMSMQGPSGFTAYRELMGVATVSVIPLLLLFLALQKRFIDGIQQGAIKG